MLQGGERYPHFPGPAFLCLQIDIQTDCPKAQRRAHTATVRVSAGRTGEEVTEGCETSGFFTGWWMNVPVHTVFSRYENQTTLTFINALR